MAAILVMLKNVNRMRICFRDVFLLSVFCFLFCFLFFPSATTIVTIEQPFSGMAERIFMKPLPNDRGKWSIGQSTSRRRFWCILRWEEIWQQWRLIAKHYSPFPIFCHPLVPPLFLFCPVPIPSLCILRERTHLTEIIAWIFAHVHTYIRHKIHIIILLWHCKLWLLTGAYISLWHHLKSIDSTLCSQHSLK